MFLATYDINAIDFRYGPLFFFDGVGGGEGLGKTAEKSHGEIIKQMFFTIIILTFNVKIF